MPVELLADAHQWWAKLSNQARDELVALYDARKEIYLFETFSEQSPDRVAGGKFIPHDDARRIDEWGEDYFQHLLDHPELVIVWDDERQRIAHVCSRHADARRSLADGEITADFRCPYQDGDCLMRNLLGERDKVSLRPLTFCR